MVTKPTLLWREDVVMETKRVSMVSNALLWKQNNVEIMATFLWKLNVLG